jgi:hypothetical protein
MEGLRSRFGRLFADTAQDGFQTEVGPDYDRLLHTLEAVMRELRIPVAPRQFRRTYTVNYLVLYPDGGRHYRADILEAGLGSQFSMWVNGDRIDFSEKVIRKAGNLSQAWSKLADIVQNFTSQLGDQLKGVLIDFDTAMADFEHQYIFELIVAEQKAKSYLQQAIQEERGLRMLKLESSRACRDGERRLIRCLCVLNSVANQRRKGRDDLTVEILWSARATLQRCTAESAGEAASGLAAILAQDVVTSYETMREYLRKVEGCLERVDPHLCNNSCLVDRLVDWEESWERGARYVQDQDLFAALCDTFAICRRAQAVAPALNMMVQECDADLFMVLPRIIWLRFLFTHHSVLKILQTMLPHRFPADADSVQPVSARPIVDAELGVFMDQFQDCMRTLRLGLSKASYFATDDAETIALDMLIQRSVSFSARNCEIHDDIAIGLGLQQDARNAIDSIVHGIEKWSIELQRHCPHDWNTCCAIMAKCLMAADQPAPTPTHDQTCTSFIV